MREGFRSIGAALRIAFRADPSRAAAVFVAQPLIGVMVGLMPLFLKLLTDGVTRGDAGLAVTGAGLVGAAILVGVMTSLGGFIFSMRLREATDLEVDRRLIGLATGVPGIDHYERPEYLDRLELLRTGRSGLSQVVEPLAHSLRTLVELGTTAGVLLTVHPLLVLLPLFGIPSLVVTGRSQRRIEAMQDETAEARREVLHLFDLATTPGPAKEIRVFGTGDELVSRYRRTWEEIDRLHTHAYVRASVVRGLGWLTFALGFVLAVGLVAREAVAGRATPGDVVLASWVAANVNTSVSSVAGLLGWLVSSLKTVGRYLWLVDYAHEAETRLVPPSERAPTPDRLTGGIRLEGVSFTYPGTDRLALSAVDLALPAASTVAVVGENGAGKTTLVKLLARLYDPTEGRITVDGIDLRRLDHEDWRARLAAGFQDFVCFEVEALTAVGVGDLPRVGDRVAVGAALDRAGAVGFAEELPDGLDTMLGASGGGTELSGGQWQKLALGRAMMRDHPLLLILDEPTAAIDAETEHRLFEGYAAASRAVARDTGGITLLVSHRFSTVRMADLIVVVDDGKVIETGTHEQLMAHGELYAELYELQAGSYR